MSKKKSQRERIKARLKNGGTVTPLEALKNFGCFRLSARIHELRNQDNGLEIVTEREHLDGNRTCARYKLADA